MKSALACFLVILYTFTLSAKEAINPTSLEATKDVIRIGAILPLSGPQAHTGEDFRDALKMGLAEQNARALKYKYEIIYEDSQNTPRLSAEAFKKLADIDHVNMVLTFFGGPASTVTPLADYKKIIHIASAFSASVAKKPYCFNNYAQPAPNAKMMAEFCRASDYKRVAFISQQQASTNSLEECFKKISPSCGIEIVGMQKYAPPEKDFRVAILKVRETKPDLLFIHAFEPEAGIILKQIKEIKWDIPISAMAHWGTFDNPEFYNWPYVEFAANQEYIDKFSKIYNRKPAYYTACVLDSLAMYITACEEYTGSGVPPADFISQKLHAIKDYPGLMGKLTPDETGWFSTPPSMVVMTKEGVKTISMEEAVSLSRARK